MAQHDYIIGGDEETEWAQVAREARDPINWVKLGLALLLFVSYLMGAFDVFLTELGLPLAFHDCYSNAFGQVWCDGPWSTRPIPEGAVSTPDGFVLP